MELNGAGDEAVDPDTVRYSTHTRTMVVFRSSSPHYTLALACRSSFRRQVNLSAINILEDLVGLGVQLLLLPHADYRQCQFHIPRG